MESMLSKYINGIDGWYFLNNDSNKVIDEISGLNISSQNYALKWRSLFIDRQVKADDLGVRLVTFIVPNKHCIFPQYLPEEIKVSDQRLVLLGDFDQLQSVIYETELFSNTDTFHKNDTHWTGYGAYQAFVRIMCEFNLEPLNSYSQESFHREYFKGDLTGSLGKKKELALNEKYQIEEVYDNGIMHVGRVRIYKNTKIKESKSGRRLAIFGGSSTKQIIDFFAHEFEVIVHVWTQSIDWEVVKEHDCNYVLALPRERFMVQVATDDLSWEYPQGNALKYLKGSAYSLSNTKGMSKYFGHIGYKDSIDLLATSLVTLNIANKTTISQTRRIIDMLDKRIVDALITKLVDIGAGEELLGFLKRQPLLTNKTLQSFKLSLDKGIVPKLLSELLGMKLSNAELLDVLKMVNKSISCGDLSKLSRSDFEESYSLYCILNEKLKPTNLYPKNTRTSGFVDGFFHSAIKGWSFSEGVDKQGVMLKINGLLIAEHESTLYRKDLEKHGVGDGKHGFSFNINFKSILKSMNDLIYVEANVIDKSTNEILPKGRILIKAPYPLLHIDNCDVNDLSGWIVDYSYPTRKIILDLFVNKVFIQRLVPKIARADLEAEGFNKISGFSVSLVGMLKAGQNTLVFKDSETGLNVSNIIKIIS
jgi:hypothetical protein